MNFHALLCTDALYTETFLSPVVESLPLTGKITPGCFEISTKPHVAGVCWLSHACLGHEEPKFLCLSPGGPNVGWKMSP